ncbi:hypothetical protein XENOCAPTIV_004729, partial [Xenoophorus captivus]
GRGFVWAGRTARARPWPTEGPDGREDKISSNQTSMMSDDHWRRRALSWLYPYAQRNNRYSGDVRDSAVSGCSGVEPDLVPDQQPPSSPALNPENESSSRSAPATGEKTHLECFPTDWANFAENIQDANIKRYILKMGPCRPKGPVPTDKDNRCFSEDFTPLPLKLG